MSLNIRSTSTFGATLLALAAAVAVAQKPTSTKRIPITKEAGGEVVRVDTVFKTDTLQVTNTVYRTDTLMRTMVRVDTVQLQPPVIPIKLPAGFYFGLAGGSSTPTGSIFDASSTGILGQLHLGWQNAKQILGGRISGTYTALGQDAAFSHGVTAKLWTLSTDAKVNVPLGHTFGFTPRLSAYGIGGWTYTWYRDLPTKLDTPDNVFIVQNGIDSWTGRNGWDAGGGLSLMWGRSEVFLEARVLGFDPTNAKHAYQVPVVFGFNWY
ncbi:MAG TPA: hypothetical protein VN706_24080 [Gemmatimonadaceae bacterium]|nr:hypothetical protein [Gemmatimonadaceae bacterium]